MIEQDPRLALLREKLAELRALNEELREVNARIRARLEERRAA